MPYTTEDGGRLNNFAEEPRVYVAKPPTKSEQRNYALLGVGALLLVAGLCSVAFLVTSAS